MSLRPAQDLVAETSKFSLRNFFEKQQEQQQLVRTPAELPIEGLPTLNTYPEVVSAHMHTSGHQIPMQPHMRLHAPMAVGVASGGLPSPKDGKFTFTGLMPVTTPMQTQHKILQQHQQQAVISTKPTANQCDSGNDLMRLKAHVVSLNERLAQANANLSATSESVIRGNKALTTERAQFHAKYAMLTKKLDATLTALSEAEALPKEDVNSSMRLNAKVLALQADNETLVTTSAALQDLLDLADASESTATQNGEEDLHQERFQEQIDLNTEQLAKFTDLAAQHSVLLDQKMHLERELEDKEALLDVADIEVSAANDRAAASVLEVAELLAKVDASQLEIVQTDSLVDQLDAKLAAARTEAAAEVEMEEEVEAEVDITMDVTPTAGCCLATARCEEMEKAAQAAQDSTNGACENECKRLHNEWQFLDSLAKRARDALTTGSPERVMVAHVYTGRCDTPTSKESFNLALHIGTNPRTMGKTIDQSCLHCPVATDAEVGVPDTLTAEGRTNAFVQAVSKDLKFSMDGSQALYASSATTGAALRV